jgi:hypothetical protein
MAWLALPAAVQRCCWIAILLFHCARQTGAWPLVFYHYLAEVDSICFRYGYQRDKIDGVVGPLKYQEVLSTENSGPASEVYVDAYPAATGRCNVADALPSLVGAWRRSPLVSGAANTFGLAAAADGPPRIEAQRLLEDGEPQVPSPDGVQYIVWNGLRTQQSAALSGGRRLPLAIGQDPSDSTRPRGECIVSVLIGNETQFVIGPLLPGSGRVVEGRCGDFDDPHTRVLFECPSGTYEYANSRLGQDSAREFCRGTSHQVSLIGSDDATAGGDSPRAVLLKGGSCSCLRSCGRHCESSEAWRPRAVSMLGALMCLISY